MSAFPPQNNYGETSYCTVSDKVAEENLPRPPPGHLVGGESPLLPHLMTYCYTEGLYDLMGNVWEWTASTYQSAGQNMRVLRGASWIDTADGSANHRARVTTR